MEDHIASISKYKERKEEQLSQTVGGLLHTLESPYPHMEDMLSIGKLIAENYQKGHNKVTDPYAFSLQFLAQNTAATEPAYATYFGLAAETYDDVIQYDTQGKIPQLAILALALGIDDLPDDTEFSTRRNVQLLCEALTTKNHDRLLTQKTGTDNSPIFDPRQQNGDESNVVIVRSFQAQLERLRNHLRNLHNFQLPPRAQGPLVRSTFPEEIRDRLSRRRAMQEIVARDRFRRDLRLALIPLVIGIILSGARDTVYANYIAHMSQDNSILYGGHPQVKPGTNGALCQDNAKDVKNFNFTVLIEELAKGPQETADFLNSSYGYGLHPQTKGDFFAEQVAAIADCNNQPSTGNLSPQQRQQAIDATAQAIDAQLKYDIETSSNLSQEEKQVAISDMAIWNHAIDPNLGKS